MRPQYLAWGDVPVGAHVRPAQATEWFMLVSGRYDGDRLWVVVSHPVSGRVYGERMVNADDPVAVSALPATVVPDIPTTSTELVGLSTEVAGDLVKILTTSRRPVRVTVDEGPPTDDRDPATRAPAR